MYVINSDLSLIVKVLVENHSMKQVSLSLNSQSGLSWEVYGDRTAPSLREVVHQAIRDYLRGQFPVLPYDLKSFPFYTQHVLSFLSHIYFGSTMTYGEIADHIGRPKSARAVGQACNRNPFPLFIPCHRVIGSNGNLTGYAGGIEIKKRLLDFEQASLTSQS